MELIIRSALALVLVVAHLPFVLGFFQRTRLREIPNTLQFAALGVVLYYDFGFVLQMFGWSYISAFFPPLDALGLEEVTLLAVLLLATPYVLALGFRVSAGRAGCLPQNPVVDLNPRLKPFFYFLFIPVCAALGAVGLSVIRGASSVVDVKMLWMGILGSGYIAFLLPMFVLAFFLRTVEGHSSAGILLIVFLLASNVVATLFLGQRTMTLLPFLMVVIFRGRFSVMRLGVSVVLLVTFASAALWFYKGFAVGREDDLGDRIHTVINNDLVRSSVLARSLQESEPIGTRILPSPGQGYFYTLLLYLPRTVFPQKGYSTAAYFTAFANGEDTEFLSWGLGLGFLEELSLNFGYLAVVPGLLIYGALLGLLQRVSHAWPASAIGTHLTAVWMSGYGSPSVFLYFGSMTLFCILLEMCFGQRCLQSPTNASPQEHCYSESRPAGSVSMGRLPVSSLSWR